MTREASGPERPEPTEVRAWLREFWCQMLRVEVPVSVNPREVGATSLSVVRMVAEIEDRWDVMMPASVLMRGATLAEIERFITTTRD